MKIVLAVKVTHAVVAAGVMLTIALNCRASSPRILASDEVHFFALLVGSNLPGPKQSPLRYAHLDTKKIHDVLLEIGKHSPDQIARLSDPDANALQLSLRHIKEQVERLPASAQSRFVFYYSGHAKSNALTLGEETVSLSDLRQAFIAIPASQKIVILDACQSGSFSRVKGVGTSDDFSHNSRAALQTTGTAVLASSTEEELSQESDELMGSIFTHNLVAGLRGAADADANGRVSLFEAYEYAYRNTLVTTADTRVGKQHVTLETDLKGTGGTVLTWPEASSAKLVLPTEVEGTITIFDEKTRTVHAEIHKAEGSTLTLAFPPGKYGVLVADDHQKVQQCDILLKEDTVTALEKRSCRVSSLRTGTAKANSPKADRDPYRFAPFVELQAGFHFLQKDPFIRRLERLGYESERFTGEKTRFILYGEAQVGVSVNRYFSFGVLYSTLARHNFQERWTENMLKTEFRTYEWIGHRVNVQIRGQYPLWHDRIVPHVVFETGPGVVLDQYKSSILDSSGDSTEQHDIGTQDEQRIWGPVVAGGVGVTARLYKVLQLVIEGKYVYAPIVANLNSETQNAGGWIVSAGIHIGQ